MLSRIRNISFLVLVVVSLSVTSLKADVPSCDEVAADCTMNHGGRTCPLTMPWCDVNTWAMDYTCEEDDENGCGDPGEVFEVGVCHIGGSC